MRRYNGNEGFFRDDNEDEMPPDGDGEAIFEVEGDVLGAMELDIAEQALNQQLLQTSVEIASRDIWWRFRRPYTRVRRIERIYRRLAGLVRESLLKPEMEN